jgi:hypothetical protein
MMSITVRFARLLLQARIARRMSACGPMRHLVHRDEMSASGGRSKPDLPSLASFGRL